jgi:hypothetical protein
MRAAGSRLVHEIPGLVPIYGLERPTLRWSITCTLGGHGAMRALDCVEGHNLRRKRENEEGEHCRKGMSVRRDEFRFELKGMNKKGTRGYEALMRQGEQSRGGAKHAVRFLL